MVKSKGLAKNAGFNRDSHVYKLMDQLENVCRNSIWGKHKEKHKVVSNSVSSGGSSLSRMYSAVTLGWSGERIRIDHETMIEPFD